MKALILAAGRGTRISNDIKNTPKCMITINGESLIRKSVNSLFLHGVNSITIVVGYLYQKIINQFKGDNRVNFIINKDYKTTNGIYSAYLARSFFDGKEDVLILSGDLFYDDKIIDVAINSLKDPILLTDCTRIHEADFRFAFDKNGVLLKYGKNLSDSETNGECLGIAKLSSSFSLIYKDHLESMINLGIKNLWWESVLYDLIGTIDIYVEDIKGLFWGEIDTYSDYLRILNNATPKN